MFQLPIPFSQDSGLLNLDLKSCLLLSPWIHKDAFLAFDKWPLSDCRTKKVGWGTRQEIDTIELETQKFFTVSQWILNGGLTLLHNIVLLISKNVCECEMQSS